MFVFESSTISELSTPGGLIAEAQSLYGEKPISWFHIMGLDSYERYLARGVRHTVPTDIVVVGRPSYFTPALKAKQPGVHFLKSEQSTNISSTMILQKLAAGEKPENLSELMDPEAAQIYLKFEPVQNILAEIAEDAALAEELLKHRPLASSKQFIYIHYGDFITLRDLEKMRFLLQLSSDVTVVLKSSEQAVSSSETSVYRQHTLLTLEQKNSNSPNRTT